MRKLDASRRTVRYAAAAFVLLAGIGCSKPPDFAVRLEAPATGEFTQYKLVVDGAPVGPLDAKQPYQSVMHGHSGSKPKDMLPRIEASVLSVCGWQPAKVEMSPPSEYGIEQARKEKRSIPLEIFLDYEQLPFNQVTVMVDNRGGAAFRLAVGEYEQPVTAGDAGKIIFPYWPHCDQARQLRMNGETIGKIEEDAKTPGTPLSLLLDVSGARCYRYEWKTYSNFPAWSGGSGQRTYKAQRVRTLSSDVDYFLQPLHSTEYSTLPVVGKSSLNEIACRNAK
jgi:hypothetical protein